MRFGDEKEIRPGRSNFYLRKVWFRNEQFRHLPATQKELPPSLDSSTRTMSAYTESNDAAMTGSTLTVTLKVFQFRQASATTTALCS